MRGAIILTAALDACVGGGGGGGGDTPRPLTLVTFNAANGAGAEWCTAEMRGRQAAFLEGLDPDVLALQEVDEGTIRVGRTDVAAAIVPPGGGLIRGRAELADGGGWYGPSLWISGRHRLLRWMMLPLPNDGSEVWPPYPAAQRIAIVADIFTADGGYNRIVATHLTAYGAHPAELRAQQFEALNQLNADVLMGDMNATLAEAGAHVSPFMVSWMQPTDGADAQASVDQIWAFPGLEAGRLVATNGVSDHKFAAVAQYPGGTR